MMYRMLIVDDEPDVSDRLYNIFKGIEHLELDIYKAYSAFEALEIMNRLKIDILMTDIYMPGMTGLQLVEKVKNQWPHCRVIFLTGHNEFDYIYSAIKYEGAAYILKTESFDRILESVEDAIKQIDNSIWVKDLEYRAKEYLDSLIPYMQKEYIGSLLTEGASTEEQRRRQFDELKIPLDPEKPFLLLMGRFGNLDRNISLMEKSGLLFKLQELAWQQFPPVLKTFFASPERFIVLWMIQPAAGLNTGKEKEAAVNWDNIVNIVRGCAEAIQNICMKSFNIAVSCIVDSEDTPWELLSSRYDSLKLLLHGYAGPGPEIMLLGRNKASAEELENQLFDYKKLKLLEEYLYSNRKNEFFNLLSELSGFLNEVKSKNYNPYLEVFYSVSIMFLSYMNRYNLTERVAHKIGLNKLTRVEDHTSYEAAVLYFKELAQVLFTLRTSEAENSTVAIINRIKQYIYAHIKEELSLARLAEKTSFNPSYLSRLFKQMTGTNLLTYINEVKMEKAKELLRNKELKIHEIAIAIGFESSSYFTQFFKRCQKLTPQEYRDKLISK